MGIDVWQEEIVLIIAMILSTILLLNGIDDLIKFIIPTVVGFYVGRKRIKKQ